MALKSFVLSQRWLTQVSIIRQKIANLDTLFRFCGQDAEIEKAYDNNKMYF